jgi:sulfatase maturation enzyme AslB (radical SAM superfamily)
MRKNFCAAPWAGLSLDPDDSAKVCCISTERTKVQNFSDVKNNTLFKEIRSAVIHDQQHKNCQVCWDREAAGDQFSRRSTYQPADFFNDLHSTDSFQLEHLDLRWSNTCNLNCVYCNSHYSSKWADLLGEKQRFRILPTVEESDLKNLKFLQLAGGEPLLIKENINLLQKLLNINPQIKIEITTNNTCGSDNKVYQLLKQFADVTVVVSFETIKEQFEYIRNGASWSQFEKNFAQLVKDFSRVQINMVYFPLSAGGISSAIEFGLQHVAPENIFIVSQFGGHGFDCVGASALQCINQRNLEFAHTLPTILSQRLTHQIKICQTQCITTHLPNYVKFDKLTNQDHRSIFTELYQ